MKGIFAVFLLIFLIGCTKGFSQNSNEIYIDNGKNLIKINAEIADDNNERANGLMFREGLDENDGMLFVFDEEKAQTFWMKNTLMPLDIIFINEELEIVDIKYAVPCLQDPCPLYKSSRPATYVLEVGGNFTAKKGIDIGDKILLNEKVLK
ncbi:DUF192 domain-containing protein [Candidatus Woesearchaeota archaeon]|nr:DUF192 domain-containing protein [Candidatus Woesearchaeota archaeon]